MNASGFVVSWSLVIFEIFKKKSYVVVVVVVLGPQTFPHIFVTLFEVKRQHSPSGYAVGLRPTALERILWWIVKEA